MDTLPPTVKRCAACGETKSLTEFSKNRRVSDGHHYRCRECANAYRRQNPRYLAKAREYKRQRPDVMQRQRREYRENNREREAAKQREWYQANLEACRLKALQKARRRHAQTYNAEGSHTVEEWLAKLAAYQGKCHWCGQTITGRAHGDHLIPLSRGGSDDISNVVPSCASCNTRKKDKLPHEFMEGRLL